MPPPTKRIYQVPKQHSTGSSYPRTQSIGSRSYCPHDPPSSFQMKVESPGGISPPGAPRSVREPLDSHGSRCSAVSMAQLPMSEERRICAAKPIKPVACSFGFETQPFEFAARPADDIEVNPLQGRTQLRSVEVAVVVDPASNARVVHLGQIWQGFVAAMMKRPAPDRSANERQRLRAGGG